MAPVGGRGSASLASRDRHPGAAKPVLHPIRFPGHVNLVCSQPRVAHADLLLRQPSTACPRGDICAYPSGIPPGDIEKEKRRAGLLGGAGIAVPGEKEVEAQP